MSTPKRTRQCEACRRRTTAAIPRWWTGPAEDAPCTACRKLPRYQAMIESYDRRPPKAIAEPIEAPPAHRSPPPQTRPTRPAASDQTNGRPPAAPRDTAANKRPPKALLRTRGLTFGARTMAWALWSHSRPADRERLRICALSIAEIMTWTGCDRRRAFEHIDQLVDAGWVVRGRLPKLSRGRARPVLVLYPSPLSTVAAGLRKAEGRMEIDHGRAQPPSKPRILDEPRDDAAWGRAVARRRARESRLPKGNVMHRE